MSFLSEETKLPGKLTYLSRFYHARSDGSNDKDKSEDLSTEKCLLAAANIVRLVRLLKGSAGLARSAPGVQLCATTCLPDEPSGAGAS